MLAIAVLTAASLAGAARAAEPLQLSLAVDAGAHDRAHTPVRLSIAVPKELAEATTADVVDQHGNAWIGQLTDPGLLAEPATTGEQHVVRQLHWVLDELPASHSLRLEVTIPASSTEADAFAWHTEPERFAELRRGERPVLRYMFEPLDASSDQRRQDTNKVYHHVWDPRGERYVTKGPGGLFPHHRGLFYGWNRIRYGDGQQADTWHCNQGEFQAHREFLLVEQGPVLGRHRLAIDWHGRDGEVFAQEQREMTVYNVPGGLLIEFASRLESTVGPLQLDGDPQHAGFQFRASQHVPDHTADRTYYLRPDGRGEPGSFRNWPDQPRHADLPWNAISFVIDDQRYTCAYLDHPDNPKEARYSERDYGRFGSYFEYELDAGRPLETNYRVWLQEGEMEVADVEELRADFADPPRLAAAAE